MRYVAYLQEILSLCKKADAAMSEDAKVGHISKGIADDALQLQVIRNCSIVEGSSESAADDRQRSSVQARGRRIPLNVMRLLRMPPTLIWDVTHNMVAPTTDDVVKLVRRGPLSHDASF